MSEHLPGDNRLPILGNDTIRDLPVSAFDTVMSDYAADAQQAELAALRAENAELQEKLRLLEGIEDCIMEQESKDFDQAMELQALREWRKLLQETMFYSKKYHHWYMHWDIEGKREGDDLCFGPQTSPTLDMIGEALAACDARAIR